MKEKIDDPHREEGEPAGSLDDLEAALMNSLMGISSSAAASIGAGAVQGISGHRENDLVWLTQQYKTIIPRLALLEENVARMCNALGRMEQAFEAFKSTPGKK